MVEMMSNNEDKNGKKDPIKPDPQERKESSEMRARTDMPELEKPDWQKRQDELRRKKQKEEKEQTKQQD